MAWRPGGRAEYDPRLDPYRDRAAHLRDDAGTTVATMYVEVHGYAQVGAGHLWWRRWTPYREGVLIGYWFRDSRFADTFVLPDDVAGVLAEWTRARDDVFGRWFDVTWLDEHATEQARIELGLEPGARFDPDRRAGLGRRFAVEADLGERDRLLALLLDENTFVTHEVALALLDRHDETGLDLLVEAMARADDESTATWLVDAVHHYHHRNEGRRAGVLRRHLSDVARGPDDRRRTAASDLLGGLADPPVWPERGAR